MLRRCTIFLLFSFVLAQPSRSETDAPPGQAGKIENQAVSLFRHSSDLFRAGKYDEAIAPLNRGILLTEEHLGATHGNIATGNFLLGRIYRAQGKYKQAVVHMQRAVSLFSKIEKLRYRLPRLIEPLADLRVELAQYDAALSLYRRALKITEKELSPEHQRVATILDKLAALQSTLGRFSEAERLYGRSLNISGESFSPVPRLSTIIALANVYKRLGRAEEAESLLMRVQEATDKPIPDFYSADHVTKIADFNRERGRLEQARRLFRRALQSLEERWGRNHPNLSRTLTGLARLYEGWGRYNDALALFERDLTIIQTTFGSNHVRTAHSKSNLARALERIGDNQRAARLYRGVLNSLEHVRGRYHPEVATTLDNLARANLLLERYREAERLSKRALSIREKALEPGHVDVADSLSRLALIYKDQERYQEAETLQLRALKIQEEALGSNHPFIGVTLQNLILIYEKVGNSEAANSAKTRLSTIPEAGTRHLPLFFATNRNVLGDESFGNDISNTLSFGRVTMRVPEAQVRNRAERIGESLGRLEKARTGTLTAAEVLKIVQKQRASTSAQFVASIRKGQSRAAIFKNRALVFVHGYNNDFVGTMQRAAQLAFDLQFDGVVIPFAWPSQGNVLGYLTDNKMAKRSVDALVNFLDQLRDTMPELELHFVAHSMGNQVLLPALCSIAKRKDDKLHKFGEVIAAHADISPDDFDVFTSCFRSRVRSTTLYVNGGDTALKARCGWFSLCRAGNRIRGYGAAIAIDTTVMAKGHFRSLTRGFDHDIFIRNPILFGDLHMLLLHGKRREVSGTLKLESKLDEKRNSFYSYSRVPKLVPSEPVVVGVGCISVPVGSKSC